MTNQAEFTGGHGFAERVVRTAEDVQRRANELLDRNERGRQRELGRMVADTKGKAVLTMVCDRAFRSQDPDVVADQLRTLLEEHGIPEFFGFLDRELLRAFCILSRRIPASCLVPLVVRGVRGQSRHVVLPGEPKPLERHLQKRRKEHVRMNLNHLGDMVLGEEEARAHSDSYVRDLANPLIDCISVKISTLSPAIHSLAHAQTVAEVAGRLQTLLRVARAHSQDGRAPKLVNVDMEEYRDLSLTVDAFKKALDDKEFLKSTAGIVLQAYLPDSFEYLQSVTAWAKNRQRRGGAPIRLRIVKGANLAMEKTEAELRGWPQAPFDTKIETDANYYRMLDFAMRPENITAVHLGVASHNLFTLAHAYELGKERRVEQFFTFEMLEGMADHTRRAVQKLLGDVLLYAPVAKEDEFLSAVAYLVRRLDENTAGENFLSHSFDLRSGTPEWEFLKNQYAEAYGMKDRVSHSPRRDQDRRKDEREPRFTSLADPFRNESDTDFTLPQNREWIESVRDRWVERFGENAEEVGGRDGQRSVHERYDPSRPGVLAVRRHEVTAEEIGRAVDVAKEDPSGWRLLSPQERADILLKAARELRRARGDLIGAGMLEAGKLVTELDAEVSEAIDFAEYYARSALETANNPDLRVRGRGVGVVVSPWNFPIAIPAGGVLAALAAGNTVLLKPASDTSLIARELTRCLHRAGVPESALQFLPCAAGTAARLVAHPDVDFVILTGGTETGLKILRSRSDLPLFAETGGKNATIVTPMADREQAIKNVLRSAFSNGGQKCSATSLFILVGEVFDDPKFRRQLKDAVESLPVGPAWNFQSQTGPLIRPPSGDLRRAMDSLESGEEWLVEPKMVDGNPSLWRPGVKWGVRPGSHAHMTELFGPVLSVMKADTLEHAIALAHEPGFGLTAGLESLDEREWDLWKSRMHSGNLYINKPTVGAIVGRQPFGGFGKSAIGLGVKAGGPNYTAQFMQFEDRERPPFRSVLETQECDLGGLLKIGDIRETPENRHLLKVLQAWTDDLVCGWYSRYGIQQEMYKTLLAAGNYLSSVRDNFSLEHDPWKLRGEDNILRYLPVGNVVVRLHPDDSHFDVLSRIVAGKVSGNTVTVSIPHGLENSLTRFLTDPRRGLPELGVQTVSESDDALTRWMHEDMCLRYAGADRVPVSVYEEAAKRGFFISREKPLMDGRVELTRGYYKEQALSISYHRYGNLLLKGI